MADEDLAAARPQPRRSPIRRRASETTPAVPATEEPSPPTSGGPAPLTPRLRPAGEGAGASHLEERLDDVERHLRVAVEILEQTPHRIDQRLVTLEKDLKHHRARIDTRTRELSTMAETLASEVATLGQQVKRADEPTPDVAALTRTVDALAARLDGATNLGDDAGGSGPVTDLLDEVAGRLDALAGRIGDLGDPVSALADAGRRIDALAGRLGDLERANQAAELTARMDALVAALASGRPTAGGEGTDDGPDAPLFGVGTNDVAVRLDVLSTRVEELADNLAASPHPDADTTVVAGFADLASRLDAVTARLDTRSSDSSDGGASDVAELRTELEVGLAGLTSKVDALASQVDTSAAAAPAADLAPVLAAIEQLTVRLDGLSAKVDAAVETTTELAVSTPAPAPPPPPPAVAPPTPVRDPVLGRLEEQLARLTVEVGRLTEPPTTTTDEIAAIDVTFADPGLTDAPADGAAPPEDAVWMPPQDPAELREAARAELISWVIEVEGIGASRAEAIADAFGDLDELAAAAVDDVVALTGLPRKVAQAVLDYVNA